MHEPYFITMATPSALIIGHLWASQITNYFIFIAQLAYIFKRKASICINLPVSVLIIQEFTDTQLINK